MPAAPDPPSSAARAAAASAAASAAATASRPGGGASAPSTNASSRTYLLFLATCVFVTMTGNVLHHRIADPSRVHKHAMMSFEQRHLGGAHKDAHEEVRQMKKLVRQQVATARGVVEAQPHQKYQMGNGQGLPVAEEVPDVVGGSPMHDLAGLSCADHGGPSDEDAAEMVYWSDIPSDAQFKSPIGKDDGVRRYLTFEPDGGGFNNARMSVETFVVMAHAMGRTLVMPPSQGIYLLRKDRDKQRVHYSFKDDFYHMEQVGAEHAGLDIISMEDFLKAEALTGRLRNKTTGVAAYPPGNRTDWDGLDPKPLKEYLRDVTHLPLTWKPEKCLVAFPSDNGPEHEKELTDMMGEVKGDFPRWNKFKGAPTNVDAAPVERLKEAAAGSRTKDLCIYDETMQNEAVVHFMCYHKMRVRFLTHFYAFLFFEDWRHDLWSKRFVRDHLRYSDEIQCAAARVVAAVRKHARSRGNSTSGEFDSFHIRRGDFQYKNTRLEADQIYENSRDIIPDGTTVFVATDHQGKPWFKPLAEHYDLLFLKDFKKELEGVNTNFYGMIDQLVASRGRNFFGCYHSTFSGYIFRMRGYHSQKEKLKGWEKGEMYHSFYYTGKNEKHSYEHYEPVHSPIYSREFPTSWRDIDKGIDELWIDPLLLENR